MSNGDPPPTSGSPYIIICSGRIKVQAADTKEKKIVAAALCAARFVAFMGIAYANDLGEHNQPIEEALQPLSAIQHYLMVHFFELNKPEAEAKIAEMFNVMTAIENAY